MGKKGWVLLFVFATACGTPASTPVSYRVVATPAATGHVSVALSLPATTNAAPAPKEATSVLASSATAPKRRIVPKVVRVAGLTAFRALGSWIDVYDYTDDPSTIVPLVNDIANTGTKTLYLETSRYSAPADIQFPQALGAALDTAKARGMRVVAWYPPAFDDVARDVHRSLAAISFRSPKGNRFDAFAADIEYTSNVPDANERSARAVDYSRKLRAGAGALYPLGAIVIPPTSLEMNKTRWPNFPWSQLAPSYNVFMPMNYWTAHGADPQTATDLTKQNVAKTKALTGKPVHIIGGLGENADVNQVAAYVKAAKDAGSIGGGLYDFRTTRSDVWGELRKLNA